MNIDPQLDLLRHLESEEQWEAAESLCISLLKHFPRHANLLAEAAMMALLRSNPSVAESLLYRALAINPLNAGAYITLGMSRYEQNDFDDAEIYFRKALLIKPGDAEACRHLGTLLNELGRFHDAVPFLAEAHNRNPGSCEAALSFADALFGTGQIQKAYIVFRKILDHHADHVDARIGMGAVCESLDRMDEALEHLLRARELAPDNPKVYLNLGGVCQRLLKLDEALSYYEKALQLCPRYPAARWNICQIELLRGCYHKGFSDFDSRFDSARPVRLRNTALPLWDGSPAVGKRILVQTEQAYGDTIQFVRYIPLLAKMGLNVILENRLASLNTLLLSVVGLEAIIDGTSGNAACECTIPLQSLPGLFSTILDSVPGNVPYLSPSAEKRNIWRARLAGDRKYKIGICWAGRKFPDQRRSIPAGLLSVLNNLGGVSWYSLQVDESGAGQNNEPAGITTLIDLTEHINNFEDTAALITCLDQVITIDSAVAHLAGALAASTRLLLPFAPDWRWLLDRKDSPWYPTVSIVRQPRPGAWIEVLENVAAQLRKTLAK